MSKPRTLCSPLLILGLASCLAARLVAADYYVDAGRGRDAPTSGSQSNPFKTIQYAIQHGFTGGRAGDHTFHIAAGSYPAVYHCNYAAARDYSVRFSGASRRGVALGGITLHPRMRALYVQNLTCGTIDYDTYNPSSSRSGTLEVSNCHVRQRVVHHSISSGPPAPTRLTNCYIEHFEFDFCCDGSIEGTISDCTFGRSGITGRGGHQGCVIDRCFFHGPTKFTMFERSDLRITDCSWANAGIEVVCWSAAGHQIQLNRCVVKNPGGIGVDIHGVRLPGDDVQIDLLHCVVHGCDTGVRLPSADVDATLDRCMVIDNAGSGVVVDRAMRNFLTVSRCLIARNGSEGIWFSESPTPALGSQVEVRSSILSRNHDGMLVTGATPSRLTVTATGCTVVDNVRGGLDKVNFPNSSMNVNHCILAGANPLGASPYPVDRCLSDTVILPGTGNLNQAPGFLDRSLGNYRLDISSPAIDAGATGTAGLDFDGDARAIDIRSAGPVQDLGADEFSVDGNGHRFGAPASSPGMPRLSFLGNPTMRIGRTTSMTVRGPSPTDIAFWVLGTHTGTVLELRPGIPVYMTNTPWVFPAPRAAGGDVILSATIPNMNSAIGLGFGLQAVAGRGLGAAVSELMRFSIGR